MLFRNWIVGLSVPAIYALGISSLVYAARRNIVRETEVPGYGHVIEYSDNRGIIASRISLPVGLYVFDADRDGVADSAHIEAAGVRPLSFSRIRFTGDSTAQFQEFYTATFKALRRQDTESKKLQTQS